MSASGTTPLLGHIAHVLGSPEQLDAALEPSGRLGHAAEDLAHALPPRGAGDDTAHVLTMTCASAWTESALADPTMHA